MKKEIDELEKALDDNYKDGIYHIVKLGNLGCLCARNNDEPMTLYVIDCLETEKQEALKRNVVKFVPEIDKQIDRIEEVMNKW